MTSRWSGAAPATIHVVGPLREPVSTELRRMVQTLVCRGDRRIVLDLADLSEIDAAGVGELVRAYNLASAAEGTLWIVNAASSVRELLVRVGLFDLLTEKPKMVS
jgi:anti-anti-sigma factor